MSKAYDRVEWKFMDKLMEKLGFDRNWIDLIISCISSASFSILINGVPHGLIHPQRGLRQGDPLSPYLFILCAEGLHSLIQQAADNGAITGVSLCREGPKVTHLFFADDSLLFCRANNHECSAILDLLDKYERASGQRINRAKTQLFFSTNTRQQVRNSIKTRLGVSDAHHIEKYLGLPSFVGRGKKHSFSYIRERVWNKIQGWKEKLLSQAGREVLIKSILQAMPTFTMNCFKLPKSLCKDIESLIRKFWWGYSGEQRKTHWLAWNKLCLPKSLGGLGFRDIENFNLALLGKQVWRLLHNRDSLFYKVFKARFFPSCSIMDEGVKTAGSYAWQSILKARHVLELGSAWCIGDGLSVRIRGDKWLPGRHPRKILSPQKSLPINTKVCALLSENGAGWDEARIRGEFLPFEAREILSIPLSSRQSPDVRFWNESKNGVYSTKSAYRLLAMTASNNNPGPSCSSANRELWTNIWRLNIPNKAKHFLWRASSESLPTKKNLCRRKIITNDICDLCRDCPEDGIHAFWECYMVKEIWRKEDSCRPYISERFVNFQDLFLGILKRLEPQLVERFAMIAWCIWFKRNSARTGSTSLPFSQIHSDAIERLLEFQHAQDSHLAPLLPPNPVCWSPPPNSWCKANYDGAIFQEQSAAGLGVVIRDHEGKVIGALSDRVALPPSVEDVEALACRRAILFALELNIHSVIFEGDSEIITNSLNSSEACFAPFGHLIEDARHLASGFQAVCFAHVNRKGNGVADKLAKIARQSQSPQIWFGDIHCDAHNLVMFDSLSCCPFS